MISSFRSIGNPVLVMMLLSVVRVFPHLFSKAGWVLRKFRVLARWTPWVELRGEREFARYVFGAIWMSMSVFFKRFRMQVELPRVLPERSPDTIVQWHPWHSKWCGLDALAKWESFRWEMDGNVFPCLADREGCRQLMRDIVSKLNFVPEATWLATTGEDPLDPTTLNPIGTIQGLRTGPVHGAIQNIGVAPEWRGKGIGRELIRRALLGFQETGCKTVSLEVTVHNLAAIRLYQSVGFVNKETVFKYGFVPVH